MLRRKMCCCLASVNINKGSRGKFCLNTHKTAVQMCAQCTCIYTCRYLASSLKDDPQQKRGKEEGEVSEGKDKGKRKKRQKERREDDAQMRRNRDEKVKGKEIMIISDKEYCKGRRIKGNEKEERKK